LSRRDIIGRLLREHFTIADHEPTENLVSADAPMHHSPRVDQRVPENPCNDLGDVTAFDGFWRRQ
jgi:hypothetical protein